MDPIPCFNECNYRLRACMNASITSVFVSMRLLPLYLYECDYRLRICMNATIALVFVSMRLSPRCLYQCDYRLGAWISATIASAVRLSLPYMYIWMKGKGWKGKSSIGGTLYSIVELIRGGVIYTVLIRGYDNTTNCLIFEL